MRIEACRARSLDAEGRCCRPRLLPIVRKSPRSGRHEATILDAIIASSIDTSTSSLSIAGLSSSRSTWCMNSLRDAPWWPLHAALRCVKTPPCPRNLFCVSRTSTADLAPPDAVHSRVILTRVTTGNRLLRARALQPTGTSNHGHARRPEFGHPFGQHLAWGDVVRWAWGSNERHPIAAGLAETIG